MSQPLNKEVRLGEVERIALPLEVKVLGNIERSQKVVNWVSVLTSQDQLDVQLQTNEIAICPAHLQREMNDLEFVAFLHKLANYSVVALVLFLPISESAESVAAEIDLTLYIAPSEVMLREINKRITALLLDRQSQISERGLQLYRELSELSREGAGLSQMAKLMGKVTGKIVVIQDKRLEIQAIERSVNSIPIDDGVLLTALADQENLPAVLRNRKAAAKANRSHWQQLLLPNNSIARLISPIISGDRARGYLSIIGAADELDMLDIIAVEQGAAACALEMAKNKAVNEIKKSLRGNFLEGILAGSIQRTEIDRLASRLDHDTSHPHAILVFRWATGTDLSVRHIESTLTWLLSTNNRPTLLHIYGEDHICVFQALRSAEELSASHRLAQRLRNQLKADYPDARLVAGLAGPANHLSDWPLVHHQAVQALEVGERLNSDDLVEYSSLGIYRLLNQLDNLPSVHEFCDQVIGPLINYDNEHRSNLVQTIEEYFNHHGNVSQTAEALFIHRNTLLYRLDRIQELTHHDLNQSDMRLALHLALKLWQLRPTNSAS